MFVMNPLFDMIGISVGSRILSLDLILITMIFVVFFKSKTKMAYDLWTVFKFWIPWVMYLLIRSNFSGIGLWKFEMYCARVVIPCMAIVILYFGNPELFKKYFFNTLIIVCLFLLGSYFILEFMLLILGKPSGYPEG